MHQCSVPNCSNHAAFEVILYDVYEVPFDVFFEQDYSCPYICSEHAEENEMKSPGPRKYREIRGGFYTNRFGAQGFTIYRPLTENE